jgi:F0F1-type ATP synthase delta subunit
VDNRGLHLLVVAVEQLFLYRARKQQVLAAVLVADAVQEVQEANLQSILSSKFPVVVVAVPAVTSLEIRL